MANSRTPSRLKPTTVQRRVLKALAEDDARIVIDGANTATIQPGGARVSVQTVRALVRNGWVTEPMPPLFDRHTAGTITYDGRVNLQGHN
ncbi:MAG: hypothetical protein WCO00_00550 [Rhodospirillaceae bacterium]